MTTPIKNGFEGKRFPSVRRIFLPSTAHEIVKSCPNVEEVVCTKGSGSTIVRSLVKGKCHRVRILKGISAPLARTHHRSHIMWCSLSDRTVGRIGQDASQLKVCHCGNECELSWYLVCILPTSPT